MNTFELQKKLPRVLYRDIRRFVGPDKSCFELTDKYRECSPPFRYVQFKSGLKQNCHKECFANFHVWIPLLLSKIPDMSINVQDEQNAMHANKTHQDKWEVFWSYNPYTSNKTQSLTISNDYAPTAKLSVPEVAKSLTLAYLANSSSSSSAPLSRISIRLPYQLSRAQVQLLRGKEHQSSVHFYGSNADRWNRLVSRITIETRSDLEVFMYAIIE